MVNRERDAGVEVADFFVLRVAAVPLARFIEWGAGLQAPGLPPGSQRRQALERDASLLRARLREVCIAPTFREALFVASPTLEDSMQRWLDYPDSPGGRRTERALLRYFARMAGRATPFGLFAGCTVGAVGDRTRLVLEPAADASRRTRLDVAYVEQLQMAMERDPGLRSRLRFVPNSSLHRGAEQLRWVEVRRDGQNRSHHLVSAPVSGVLDAVLACAQAGARPDELIDAVSGHGVDAAAAGRYIDELIDAQLLVSELDLPATGQEPLDALVEGLHRVAGPDFWTELQQLPDALAELDRRAGSPPAAYRAMAAGLHKLGVTADLGHTFHVDSRRGASLLTIGPAVVGQLAEAARLLERIYRPPDLLRSFRESFVDRFDQRFVPLSEALDTELGIGIPDRPYRAAEPLLRGLPFPAGPAADITWGPRERFLLNKLHDAAASGVDELVLDEQDVRALEVDDPAPLSDGFAVMARLAADSEEALDAGRFEVYVQAVAGPSGAELLGRFGHADPDLADEIRKHLHAVERLDPDAIHAEIAHLPEGRHGNILCRPVLRDWEIPYLARSGVEPQRQIPIQDLLVGVRNEQVVLFSRRLRRRVVPQLSSAHNVDDFGTPLYWFLCAARTPRASGWAWSWGPLADAPFLPRVRIGRLVLSLRTWRLDKSAIHTLSTGERGERFDAAQQLRATRRLPRYVVVAQGDHQLPVDLDNVLCVEALGSALRARDDAQLVELWPGPDRLVARDDQGRAVSELVVPFRRRSTATSPRLSMTPAEVDSLVTPADVVRHFGPGSEWLYLKLYTPATLADRVLAAAVGAALDTGAVRRWFFIRYADPAPHLRLRLHGDPSALRDQVLPAVHAATAPLRQTGVLSRIVIDSYERELERYGGGAGIELSEALFDADSTAVLELLRCLEPGNAGSQERWQIALIGANMLLADFGLHGPSAIELLEGLRAGYGAEFRADARLTKALGERARSHRDLLSAAADPDAAPPTALSPGVQILRHRSTALTPIVEALHAREVAGQLTTSVPRLVDSYLHMHLNRILRTAQRAQELVIYDFLLRAHRSAQARK